VSHVWISAIVEWDKLTQAGKKQLIEAMVSEDVLDKLSIQESNNVELLLAIIANKHTCQMTFDLLRKHPDERVRAAVMQHELTH
jgi:hypothetical protein